MPSNEDGRRRSGGHQRSQAGNQTSYHEVYPAPSEVWERAFDLVEHLGQRYSKGRPVRLALDPEHLPALLLATAEIAGLACKFHDAVRPDGPPLLHQLREMGGAA
jgi:hypothetical protein